MAYLELKFVPGWHSNVLVLMSYSVCLYACVCVKAFLHWLWASVLWRIPTSEFVIWNDLELYLPSESLIRMNWVFSRLGPHSKLRKAHTTHHWQFWRKFSHWLEEFTSADMPGHDFDHVASCSESAGGRAGRQAAALSALRLSKLSNGSLLHVKSKLHSS